MSKPAIMITDPRNPPKELRRIERIIETSRFGTQYPWTFFAHDGVLTIMSYLDTVDDKTRAPLTFVSQVEYPIGVAAWIVEQLDPFRREGILPGALFRLEAEIDGEEVSLLRGVAIGGPDIPGFDLTNYSRKDHNLSRFNQEFSMPDPFLWEQGLWELWVRIADEHRQGLY